MHATFTRRSLRRRHVVSSSLATSQRRRHAGTSPVAALAVLFPVLLFGAFAATAAAGVVGTVSAFEYFGRDLQDPKVLEELTFSRPSTIYDRSGKKVLATVGAEQREVVTYDQLPPVVLDATTAIEDKDFWTNPGFDPAAIVSAGIDSLNGNVRGASTITQQLVRERLLDPALVQDPERRIERKIKEIIQSIRLTQAYPGDEGKRQIITTYLNQNYYGSQLYGVKAAAQGYFGIDDLNDLTLAQAALLAAIPKSPSTYDLRRNADTLDDGTIVVPEDTEIIQRRNYILDLMKDRQVLTVGDYTVADYDAAKEEPVALVPIVEPRWLAPHFVWRVRDELANVLCGEETDTCTALETGGYKIVTTLDLDMQEVAEKWVKASTLVPKSSDPRAMAKRIGVKYASWMQRLRNENVWNGALVAMDYQTGEVYAYVGSADFYAKKSTKRMQPKFDVLSDGWRQPGSAWKPVHYSIGIDDGTFTAATSFMDVTTDFGGGYTPTNADMLERGPVRLRGALQWSLNIPAIKATWMNGVEKVFERAQDMGIRFQGDAATAGLSFGIGTEVIHPVDLANAYGTIANEGRYVPHTTVLKVTDPDGTTVYEYDPPEGEQAISPQAAYIITDILKGNTNPRVNPAWGKFRIVSDGKRRPAALKTGTNDQARDLGAYGFIAPSKDPEKHPSLVVGVWNGNSDYSMLGKIFSFDAPTYVWQGFLQEVTKGWPITDWKEPDGIVHARVDAFSGMKPGPYSRETVEEIFIKGTVPKKEDDTKVAGSTCSGKQGGVLDLSDVEDGHPDSWQDAVDGWVKRAMRGAGVRGGPAEHKTATAYFAKPYFQPYGSTWGAPFGRTDECPSPEPTQPGPPGGGGGGGGGFGGPPGHRKNDATPTPLPEATASPEPSASAGDASGGTTWFALVPFLGPLVGLVPLLRTRGGRRLRGRGPHRGRRRLRHAGRP